jgi:hypothetical protein
VQIITIVLLTVAIVLMTIIADRFFAAIFLQQQADASTTNSDTCTSNNSNTTCHNQYTKGYSNYTNYTTPLILPFP